MSEDEQNPSGPWNSISNMAFYRRRRMTPRIKTVVVCEWCHVISGEWMYAADLTDDELSNRACVVCSHIGAQLVAQFK